MIRNYSKWFLAPILSLNLFAQATEDLSPKISPDLVQVMVSQDASHADDEIDLIVRFKSSTSLRNNMVRSSRMSRRAHVQSELSMIQSAVVRVPLSEVALLASSPDVEYVTPDRDVVSRMNKARAATQSEINWTKQRLDGSGIRVAVIDSGMVTNQAFATGSTSRIVFAKSFLPNTLISYTTNGLPPPTDGSPPDGSVGALSGAVYTLIPASSGSYLSTYDAYGHGSHVASIIAGAGETMDLTTAKYRGVAPKADLVNLRVLDDYGAGKESSVIAALQWILTNQADPSNNLKIRVVNLSLGRPVFESYKLDPLCKAVEAVWKAGITVVVAAGNDGRFDNGINKGYGTINSPGNDPYVITVGAGNPRGTELRTDDIPASYSSKGPSAIDHVVKPDIMAPGNRIVAFATGKLKADNPMNVVDPVNSYMELSGTSMAAPVVSAAAVLLLSQNNFLTPDQIKTRLMKTAWRGMVHSASITDPTTNVTYIVRSDLFTVGAGYLDVYAALNDNYTSNLSAQSPTATIDPITGRVSILRGTNVVWGDSTLPTNVVWGDNIKGDNVVWGDSVVWGDNVVWGDKTPAAVNCVWGDAALYSLSVGKSLAKGE